MKITSTGFLSETMFQQFDGVVRDHGTYIEVRTPKNLTFWFGNYLLLAGPPDVAEIPHWIAEFNASFSDAPDVLHKCLQWPDTGVETTALRAEFERLGWVIDQASVLSAETTKPVRAVPAGVVFRKIEHEADWAQVLEHQVATRADSFAEVPYRAFKIKRLAFFRGLQHAGHGAWYGAFKGGTLVADMGIFHRAGISRFQEVSTHPATKWLSLRMLARLLRGFTKAWATGKLSRFSLWFCGLKAGMLKKGLNPRKGGIGLGEDAMKKRPDMRKVFPDIHRGFHTGLAQLGGHCKAVITQDLAG